MIAKNSPYAHFQTSNNLEVEGVIIDYGDFKIKIARAGGSNTRFSNAMMKHCKPHRKAIQSGTINDKVWRRLLAQIYAESVVLGWDGMVDAKGKDLPFTVENCVKLFIDLPDFFDQIISEAENFRLFKEEEDEDLAGN